MLAKYFPNPRAQHKLKTQIQDDLDAEDEEFNDNSIEGEEGEEDTGEAEDEEVVEEDNEEVEETEVVESVEEQEKRTLMRNCYSALVDTLAKQVKNNVMWL